MRNGWVCALTAGGMLATGILGFSNYTWAGEVAPPGAPTVAQLMARDLDGISNKEALLITVTYLPGGASLPHRHDAQVFVYVLEGAMTMQVDGSAPVTLRPGQTFYEGPQDVHRVSANASQTEPAKILVFMVKDKRKPASRPVAAETTGQERAEAAGKGLVGSPAPRAVVKTIDGDTIDLGALYGKKAVYLKFWATWCVPCRQQMPHFEHTYETAGPDLAVIAIDVGFNESLEEIQRYRRALGITMPIILDDGQLGGAFNLRVTPQHIVIGRDGRIQYVGHLADARLDAALVAARQPALPKADGGGGCRHFRALSVLRPRGTRCQSLTRKLPGDPAFGLEWPWVCGCAYYLGERTVSGPVGSWMTLSVPASCSRSRDSSVVSSWITCA